MGQEYKITVAASPSDAAQADFCLRRVPGFTNFDAARGDYIFRGPGNAEARPDVVMKIESDGFYLCEFGASNAIIGAIVRTIVAQFGALFIGDYEP